jgi:hypothetical protein
MLNSEVIVVSIERPYAEVYAFCADPLNFARWASEPDSMMEPLGSSEYLVDLPQGRRVMRFSPQNKFGVLDYQVFEQGQSGGPVRPVRLIENANGADIQFTLMQDEGMSDEHFRSASEWIRSDLQRLKSLLEGA